MIDNQTKQDIINALKLLSENNSSIRIEAVKKLGVIGVAHPQIIERLQSVASNDTSSDVRLEAKHSLELLQPAPINNTPPANLSQPQSRYLSQANEKAIIELLKTQNGILEEQKEILEILEEQNEIREFSISKHAGSGAIIAAMIASLWVLQYLVSAGTILPYWQWVTEIRNTQGLGLTEALFIIVARFLVAFGITWAPITVIISIIRK